VTSSLRVASQLQGDERSNARISSSSSSRPPPHRRCGRLNRGAARPPARLNTTINSANLQLQRTPAPPPLSSTALRERLFHPAAPTDQSPLSAGRFNRLFKEQAIAATMLSFYRHRVKKQQKK